MPHPIAAGTAWKGGTVKDGIEEMNSGRGSPARVLLKRLAPSAQEWVTSTAESGATPPGATGRGAAALRPLQAGDDSPYCQLGNLSASAFYVA